MRFYGGFALEKDCRCGMGPCHIVNRPCSPPRPRPQSLSAVPGAGAEPGPEPDRPALPGTARPARLSPARPTTAA